MGKINGKLLPEQAPLKKWPSTNALYRNALLY